MPTWFPSGANSLGALWFFIAFAVLLAVYVWRGRRK